MFSKFKFDISPFEFSPKLNPLSLIFKPVIKLPVTFAPETSKQSLSIFSQKIFEKLIFPKSISIASAWILLNFKFLILLLDEIILIASSLFDATTWVSIISTFEFIILTPPYNILSFTFGYDKFLNITFLSL